MKDYGCGTKLDDGLPCTSLNNDKFLARLCDPCLEKLAIRVNELEDALTRLLEWAEEGLEPFMMDADELVQARRVLGREEV